MGELDFIYRRHSTRKFKKLPVPRTDIVKMIEAATMAPSGKNAQNWHFVVVTSRKKISGIAGAIEMKNKILAGKLKDERERIKFEKFLRFSIFFTEAPVLILVYATGYPITGLDVLRSTGAPEEEIEDLLRSNPGIQNIGAAVENFHLAAAALGYGTCWMTSPNYAAKEISEYLGCTKEGYFLVAMTPLGFPDADTVSTDRRPIEEVVTFVE